MIRRWLLKFYLRRAVNVVRRLDDCNFWQADYAFTSGRRYTLTIERTN